MKQKGYIVISSKGRTLSAFSIIGIWSGDEILGQFAVKGKPLIFASKKSAKSISDYLNAESFTSGSGKYGKWNVEEKQL